MTTVYSVGWEESDIIKVVLENPNISDGHDRLIAEGAAAANLDVDTTQLAWLDTTDCDGDAGLLPRNLGPDYVDDRAPISRIIRFWWDASKA